MCTVLEANYFCEVMNTNIVSVLTKSASIAKWRPPSYTKSRMMSISWRKGGRKEEGEDRKEGGRERGREGGSRRGKQKEESRRKKGGGRGRRGGGKLSYCNI